MMTWRSVRLCHVVTVDYHPEGRPKCVSLGVWSLNVLTLDLMPYRTYPFLLFM